MAQRGSAVRFFLFFLVAELTGLEGPHYEFGNMNCPCGGGFHPGRQTQTPPRASGQRYEREGLQPPGDDQLSG